MSLSEVKELEGAVKELLHELVSDCSEEQFHVILLMLRESLAVSKVEGGHHTVSLLVLLHHKCHYCIIM